MATIYWALSAYYMSGTVQSTLFAFSYWILAFLLVLLSKRKQHTSIIPIL